MPKLINQDNYGVRIVDNNGVPTQAFYSLISALCNLEIMDGSGTPESVLVATRKSLYLDNDTNVVYVKTTDYGDKTGWVALN